MATIFNASIITITIAIIKHEILGNVHATTINLPWRPSDDDAVCPFPRYP